MIQQTQVPDFTIQTSDPIVTNADRSRSRARWTSPGRPRPSRARGQPVRACRRAAARSGGDDHDHRHGRELRFANVESTTNELYQVRTTFAPARHTSRLFEGVQDVVTMTAELVDLDGRRAHHVHGNVSPDKAGHVIYLQKLGADSDWHTVEIRFVNNELDVPVRLDVRHRRRQAVPGPDHRRSGQRRRRLGAGDDRRHSAAAVIASDGSARAGEHGAAPGLVAQAAGAGRRFGPRGWTARAGVR